MLHSSDSVCQYRVDISDWNCQVKDLLFLFSCEGKESVKVSRGISCQFGWIFESFTISNKIYVGLHDTNNSNSRDLIRWNAICVQFVLATVNGITMRMLYKPNASKVATGILVWFPWPFALYCLSESGFNTLSPKLFKNIPAKPKTWSERS